MFKMRIACVVLASTFLFLVGPAKAKTSYQYLIGSQYVPAIAADPVASAALDGTRVYINIETIKSRDGQPAVFPVHPPSVPAGWQAFFIYRWASAQQMERDIANVPTWISGCMYDNENAHMVPMTPDEERAAPAPYYQRAAAACHKAGKVFIATGGMRFGARNSDTDTFATARVWDIYALQTQTGEDNLTKFTSLIGKLQQRVLANNPKARFIVGVGDFAGGSFQPPSVAEAAIRAIPAGTGIWMNFGEHAGPNCRGNGCPIPARPDILVQVIKDMAK